MFTPGNPPSTDAIRLITGRSLQVQDTDTMEYTVFIERLHSLISGTLFRY